MYVSQWEKESEIAHVYLWLCECKITLTRNLFFLGVIRAFLLFCTQQIFTLLSCLCVYCLIYHRAVWISSAQLTDSSSLREFESSACLQWLLSSTGEKRRIYCRTITKKAQAARGKHNLFRIYNIHSAINIHHSTEQERRKKSSHSHKGSSEWVCIHVFPTNSRVINHWYFISI